MKFSPEVETEFSVGLSGSSSMLPGLSAFPPLGWGATGQRGLLPTTQEIGPIAMALVVLLDSSRD